MARTRSLPAVNVPTVKRLLQQDPAQGIEKTYVPSLLIQKFVTPLIDLPKEVGSKLKRVWPEVADSFREKKNVFLEIATLG